MSSHIRPLRASVAFAAFAVAGMLLSSCASADTAEPTASSTTAPVPPALNGGEAHFSYDGDTGPEHWGELSSDYAACATGTSQSPIDLSGAAQANDGIDVSYMVTDEDIANNGHSIQMNTQAGDSVGYEGVTYNLAQMHFHAPAEHTIDGVQAPAEFHFVHQDADGNRLVLAVMAKVGSDNPAWSDFIAATSTPEETTVAGSIDLAAMVPDTLAHYAYTGSLTTPPCAEDVQWIVLTTPVELSSSQIETLDAAYINNNRPVQPLNGRELTLNSAAQ